MMTSQWTGLYLAAGVLFSFILYKAHFKMKPNCPASPEKHLLEFSIYVLIWPIVISVIIAFVLAALANHWLFHRHSHKDHGDDEEEP